MPIKQEIELSLLRKAQVECPNCHKMGMYDYWEYVNVNLNPELREKIFTEEIFMYYCPHCGKSTKVPTNMIYYDMYNKFMLFFNFYWNENYNYTSEISKLGLNVSQEYQIRIVTGVNRFKEKIKIMEMGLNDVAIERMKYMIRYKLKEIITKDYELFFDSIGESDEENEHGTIFFVYFDEEKQSQMSFNLPMESYYQYQLACELDPRMHINGCVCVNQEWMAVKMKEE